MNFSHAAAGATNCTSCHAGSKPANHYTAQCSACHGTSAWRPANFSHAAAGATNCTSCHAGSKPANHYTAQCSQCHSTNAWRPANFNHAVAGATDCQACHAKARPANHFSGQCSQCHTTSGWKPATFKHTFPLNHNGANSNCAKCHPSAPPAYTCFGCHNQTELQKKHAEKNVPFANCMQCHADGKD